MKKLIPFMLLVAFFVATSSPASAYYLTKINAGKVTIFQGAVLGDSQEAPEQPEQPEQKRPETSEQRPQEQRPQENRTQETRNQQEGRASENQREMAKKQAELNKEGTKELGKLQKKIELNDKKLRIMMDPQASSVQVQQQTPENDQRVQELLKKRMELQGELSSKSKELTQKQKELLQEQIKNTKDQEDSLKARVINKIEDANLEIQTQNNLNLKMDDRGQKDIQIEKGDANVSTQLPVGVNAEGGNLVIKTPKQEIETQHTPDRVLEMLKEKKVIDVMSKDSTGAAESKLVMQNDKPIYEIKGTRKARFLGVLPIEIKKDVQVSAETGSLLNSNQDTISRFLELFSF